MKGEWKEKDTEEQFIYRTRKKGFGPFKPELWQLPTDVRDEICAELEGKFAFLFDKLMVMGTRQCWINSSSLRMCRWKCEDAEGLKVIN